MKDCNIDLSNPTEELAYWMGFLMADGCISIETGKLKKKRPRLYLNLTEEDKNHIYKFCNFLNISRNRVGIRKPIGRQKQNVYRLCLSISNNDVISFSKYGIVPRKTYNFCKPDVEKYLLPHYLRGWLDGDGYIKNTYPEVMRITGNKDAIKWYAEAIKTLGYNRNVSYYAKNKDVWGKIQIGGRINIAKIVDILQVKDNIKLDRKWENAIIWNELVKNGKIRKQYKGDPYESVETIIGQNVCTTCGNV